MNFQKKAFLLNTLLCTQEGALLYTLDNVCAHVKRYLLCTQTYCSIARAQKMSSLHRRNLFCAHRGGLFSVH